MISVLQPVAVLLDNLPVSRKDEKVILGKYGSSINRFLEQRSGIHVFSMTKKLILYDYEAIENLRPEARSIIRQYIV